MRAKAVGAGMLVAMACAGAGASPAGGGIGDARIVAGPGAATTGYLTLQTVVRKGRPANFVNLDVPLHDVVSVNGLFRSALIGLGKAAPVTGVEQLGTGAYGFYCSLHPNMRGTLRVIN